MKKFFLILFSEFESGENFDDILQVISPIVDSSFLKFVNHKGSIIIHFGSEVDQDEINEYLKGSFFGEIITFILTEYNDKMSIYMSKEILEHLLDLETNTGNGDIVIDINH